MLLSILVPTLAFTARRLPGAPASLGVHAVRPEQGRDGLCVRGPALTVCGAGAAPALRCDRRGAPVLALQQDGSPQSTVAEQAAELTARLRRAVEDAEEELRVEVVHSSKFMWRGDGLRRDFASARPARQRALLRAVIENEGALLAAMEEADAAGLPRDYMEDAIRVLGELALVRAELQRDYVRVSETRVSAGDAKSGEGS